MHLLHARDHAWRPWAFVVVFGGYLVVAALSSAEASEPAKARGWYTGWGFGPIDLTLTHIGRPVPGPPPLSPRLPPRAPTPSETAGAPDMS